MTYRSLYDTQIQNLKIKYPYFKPIDPNPNLFFILDQLELSDEVKCAIIAIDTSMQMQKVIDRSNKDVSVLSADVLSALFYHYIAQAFDSKIFYTLTNCVKVFNEQSALSLNTSLSDEKSFQLKYCFVLPFMTERQIRTIINQ